MKKAYQVKGLLLAMAVAGSVAIAPSTAQAGVSANVAGVSDYIWRGMNQSSSAGNMALQGGLDYEADSGLFVGAWSSTMDKGYEYDLYAGYGGSFEGVDLGAAYTSYMYTEDSSTNEINFQEVNLSAGYGMVSLGYDINVTKGASDTHYSVSVDMGDIAEGMALTYGATTDRGSKDKTYLDIGYSSEVEGFDFAADVIMGSGALSNTYFVVGLAKSFDLM